MLLDNRYRIIKALGTGGFGETYLAEDTHMPSNRRCVIKQLKPVTQDPAAYQVVKDRFQREAAILENLGDSCHQIPRLYAYFESAGQFYLVQEWIEGKTLRIKLLEEGVLSESLVQQILVDLLPVLDYVHSQRMVHRDIKPDNIILRQSDGKPVLIDFGAVKETMGTVMTSGGNVNPSIVIGTPGFMPREQSAGLPVYSSDLYSLGLTAICLLTGKSPQQLAVNSQTGEMLWRQYGLTVSSAFAAVLDQAIQPFARDRYPTAKAMLEALQGSTTPIAPTVVVHRPPTPAPQFEQVSYQPTVPSPASVAYQPSPVISSPPQPTSTGGDWLKALIVGSVIGISCLIGFVFLKPQIPLFAERSPSSSTSTTPLPSASISQPEAINVINTWLAAKRDIFAPPYSRDRAAEITTGQFYEDTAGSNGSINWLETNNAYYHYGVQKIEGVDNFVANGNQATLETRVTEDRTLFQNGQVNPQQTDFKTTRVRYTLQFVDGRWKIAASQILN